MTERVRPISLALGGLAATAAALGIGRFVYTPILPLMLEDLGMTKSGAGLLASANFAGYLVGALVAAMPSLPGSRRRWLISAVAVSSLTTAAMALPSSSVAFLILRFMGGLASAFALVFSSALVLDRLGAAGRSRLSALHFAGVGAGIAISAAFVSVLASRGWRVLWVAGGLTSAVAIGVVAALIPDRAELITTKHSLAAKPGPPLTTLVVAYGLFGFGYIITATFLVAMVRGSHEVRAFEPFVWLLVGVTAAPSVAVWTFIEGRIAIARAFALACALQSVGVASSVLWVRPAGVLLAAALLGGTFMGITALGLIWARRLSQGDPRRTLALMTASFGLGQIVGPAFAGVAYDVTGSLLVPSLTAAAALVLGATLAILRSA